MSTQRPLKFIRSLLPTAMLALVLAGCRGTAQNPDLQNYVVYANQYIASQYPDEYTHYLRHVVDSLGLQTLDPADSNWANVQGATYLGGFSMYQMPTYCGVFSIDVLGDSVPEQMLCIAHGNMGLFNDYTFLFFGSDGPKHAPFAEYSISAGDLIQITFKQLCGNPSPELLLYYDHFPSVYLNAGLEIVSIRPDTAILLANIGTMFYDWKDYGKYEVPSTPLADGEAYRELSSLQFEDGDQDGCMEIKLQRQMAIVSQDWEKAIDSLDVLRLLGTDSSRWRFSAQRLSYVIDE